MFLPTYRDGQYPIAVFTLPPELAASSEKVNVRLWISPNRNDGANQIMDPLRSSTITLGKNTISEIKCEWKRDDSGNTSMIKVVRGRDPRDFFVNCKGFKSFLQRTNFVDGIRTDETFQFSVPKEDEAFTLSILPEDDYSKIMQRVENATGNNGKDRDPIFGDPNTHWLNFENIDLQP